MECARHGEVEYQTTVNDSRLAGGHIHYLSCGCKGTSEQLRDPDYDPNPPSADAARVAELEAEVAALKEQLAAKPKAAAKPKENA